MSITNYKHTEQIYNLKAPRQIVPIIMKSIHPNNVLDVGCGVGTWLKVFEENGIIDYIGIDVVTPEKLHIPQAKFLTKDISKPFDLKRKFDLVVSLEVAEHLPEASADAFVKSLIIHSDTILFSAAIPGQGGQHHVNEQWPEYWEEKFSKHGFFFQDCIRPLIWKNENIDWWYKQNIFLLTKEKPSEDLKRMISLVHPELHTQIMNTTVQYTESLMQGKQGLRVSSKIFSRAIIYKVKSLLGL